MAKNLITKAKIEQWNTKQGPVLRIVTREKATGKFYDNISMATLLTK